MYIFKEYMRIHFMWLKIEKIDIKHLYIQQI